MSANPAEPNVAELYTPKLITVLREGYGLAALRADAISGLTVAIVALPLSMAIAIASGVGPERGLYTAIVGGFLVSLFSGSRFQIGGPAGAFIVLVATTMLQHGLDGLLLATFVSGLFLALAGALRLGTFVKYIPFPVTVGFTAGIAIIIAASQLKEAFGLTLPGAEPAALMPKLEALWQARPTLNAATAGLTALTVALIVGIKRLDSRWPNLLFAVAAATLAAALLDLPVETIASRFGAMPSSLPAPALPAFDLAKLMAVLPNAAAFALLGSIESLLSAVVADSMTGRRHRSNCELIAQGIANVGSALFGGICVTGTIARTATNVRSGARGPIAGMLHSLFLLLFIWIAAPLAGYIPLAALAGVLLIVAWNMVERHQIVALLRTSRGEAFVLIVTLILTIFRDLTEGIVAGFALSSLLFIHRMGQSVAVEAAVPHIEPDRADGGDVNRYAADTVTDRDIIVYRISGAFFFGAAASVAAALDRVGAQPKAYVIDFSAVTVIDSTAASAVEGFRRKAAAQSARLVLAGARPAVERMLWGHGLHPPEATFMSSVDEAIATLRGDAKTPT
ncbi:MAG TPA: SulP family inorganic anion transporter [Alphaproteobacteria bacterium]|nr:SulP family inorganic anion transporter [Alphaproteobacteria bacterium]